MLTQPPPPVPVWHPTVDTWIAVGGILLTFLLVPGVRRRVLHPITWWREYRIGVLELLISLACHEFPFHEVLLLRLLARGIASTLAQMLTMLLFYMLSRSITYHLVTSTVDTLCFFVISFNTARWWLIVLVLRSLAADDDMIEVKRRKLELLRTLVKKPAEQP